MDSLITQKAEAFILLKDHPWILVLFVISLFFFAVIALIIIIIIKKPEWIKHIFVKNADDSNNPCAEKKTKKSKDSKCKNIIGIKKGYDAINKKLNQLVLMTEEDRNQREERQKDVDQRFYSIEYLLGKVSQGTLVNSMRDETQPIMRRLKNFRRLIATKKNGRDKAYGINLILQNKDVWQDLKETAPNVDITIIDVDYYNETMAEIERKIFESGGYR